MILSSIFGLALSVAPPACYPAWRPVYHHDVNGRAIEGSKANLLAAIRKGDPIRIAWGMSVTARDGKTISVEHNADPVFTSIMSGEEVVVQIPEHIGQTAYHDAAAARFDKPGVMWRGMFSTSGRFDAVFVDRATGQEIRRIPQRAAIHWFAFAPPSECDERATRTLATPGGVVLDQVQGK